MHLEKWWKGGVHGSVAVQDRGKGRDPTGPSDGGVERFVFKCRLKVGEMDGESLHTAEREKERERGV